MKLIFCKTCQDLIQLVSHEVRICSCGNIQGKYDEDGVTALIHAIEVDKARIVGIANPWLFNDHMHFSDGLIGSFDDDKNTRSMFNLRGSPVVIVHLFTTGDVQPLVINEILQSTEHPDKSAVRLFLVKQLETALEKQSGLEQLCIDNAWTVFADGINHNQNFYDNEHVIKIMKELIVELKGPDSIDVKGTLPTWGDKHTNIHSMTPAWKIPEKYMNEKGFENFQREFMNTPLGNDPMIVNHPMFCTICFEPVPFNLMSEEEKWQKNHRVDCHNIAKDISAEMRVEYNRRMRDDRDTFKIFIDKIRGRA